MLQSFKYTAKELLCNQRTKRDRLKDNGNTYFIDTVQILKLVHPCRIMTSTSQKHRNFVSEPMGEKKVYQLAGIGKVLGKRLEEKGFDKARAVLGQFLVLNKDKEMFLDWIEEECGANKKQREDCYNCLKEWCDAFL